MHIKKGQNVKKNEKAKISLLSNIFVIKYIEQIGMEV